MDWHSGSIAAAPSPMSSRYDGAYEREGETIVAGARTKALLMYFGTGRAVRNARLAGMQKASGVSGSVAQLVSDFYPAR